MKIAVMTFWFVMMVSGLSLAKETQNSAGSSALPSATARDSEVSPPTTLPKRQQNTGDIDMNQFRDLDKAPPSSHASTRNVPVEMTCTTPNGVVLKKGETGFDTCLTNSQSRLLKQQHTPEAPDDPRTF